MSYKDKSGSGSERVCSGTVGRKEGASMGMVLNVERGGERRCEREGLRGDGG